MPTRRVHAPLASDLVGSWRMERIIGAGVIYAPTSPTSSTAFISANLSRHSFAVSYMRVEELGFVVGEVVLAVGVAAKMALAVSMLSIYALVRLRGAW